MESKVVRSLPKQQVNFWQHIEVQNQRGVNMNIAESLQYMLSQDAIIVQQATELVNVIIGVDTSNKYDVFSPEGHKLGSVAEVSGGAGGFILRQILNNARSCNLQIFDPQGQQIGLFRKPLRFIFTEMSAEADAMEIGRAKRTSWIGRNYIISVGSGESLFTINSSLFQWRRIKFDVMRNGVLVASIRKKFEGYLRMAFTQADNFSIEFIDKSLTLEERYTLFATLFLIDFDVFEQK